MKYSIYHLPKIQGVTYGTTSTTTNVEKRKKIINNNSMRRKPHPQANYQDSISAITFNKRHLQIPLGNINQTFYDRQLFSCESLKTTIFLEEKALIAFLALSLTTLPDSNKFHSLESCNIHI